MSAWSKWLGSMVLGVLVGAPALALDPVSLSAKSVKRVADPAEGQYSRGTVDSAEQLFVLPNNDFCFALMAGSLDLLAWGRWERIPGKPSAYSFREIKQSSTLYPMVAQNNPEIADDEVLIEFMGYAMSRAEYPVFAVSSTDQVPAKMRNLFPDDKYQWSDRYSLPKMKKSTAKYLFIGNVSSGDEDHPYRQAPKPEILVYTLPEGVNHVRFGYDSRGAMPPINFDLILRGNQLATMDGDRGFTKRDRKFTDRDLDQIYENCRPPNEQDEEDSGMIKPSRSFVLAPNKVDATPYFGPGSDADDGYDNTEVPRIEPARDVPRVKDQTPD